MLPEAARGVAGYVIDPSAIDVEYVIPSSTRLEGVFLFVVDVGVDSDELEALKESLLVALENLPQDSLVGFITFGHNVSVYETSHVESFRTHTFNGARAYSKEDVASKLRLFPNKDRNPHNRFVQRLDYHQYSLGQFVQSLRPEGFALKPGHRRELATGTALCVAEGLLAGLFPKRGARIVAFVGGPSTRGEGSIVETPLKTPLRSHHDLRSKGKLAKRYDQARELYEKLGKSATAQGHCLDVFVGCYDQVGLSEMEPLVSKTGGVIVQSDSFTSAIFKQSLQRFVEGQSASEGLQFGLNGVLEVKATCVRITNLVGNGIPIEKANKANGGSWKLGSISNHSSYAIFYELAEEAPTCSFALVQFITSYQGHDGGRRVHVTTTQIPLVPSPSDMGALCHGFDQEACAVTTARDVVANLIQDPRFDPTAMSDKVLVETLRTFASYHKGQASSVSIPEPMRMLPQLMYYLRRCALVQSFNASPDETSYYRHCFLTEDVTNALVMIQPTLTAYDVNEEPVPVLLDTRSLKPDRILLLDTFFHILIYHGSAVAEWRREGYADRDEYAYLREYFEAPRQEAADLLVDRFPLPRFVDTEEGASQARFLVSRLNPGESYKTATHGGPVALTDDASLQTLLDHVYKVITTV